MRQHIEQEPGEMSVANKSAGYAGRLMLHDDPFSKLGFKVNVILLTIAPAFLSAGLYVILKRLVLLFGPQYSRISPNAYAYIFVSADVLSIILQGAGGSISAVATEKIFLDQGVDIMIAGLVSQVFTLMIFAGLCVDFARQVSKHHHLLPVARQQLKRSWRFRFMIIAMTFAFLCILTRCAYRVAELSQGWGSELMRKEKDFIIMDSMLVNATLGLTSDNVGTSVIFLTSLTECAPPPPSFSMYSTPAIPCRSLMRPTTIGPSRSKRKKKPRGTPH